MASKLQELESELLALSHMPVFDIQAYEEITAEMGRELEYIREAEEQTDLFDTQGYA